MFSSLPPMIKTLHKQLTKLLPWVYLQATTSMYSAENVWFGFVWTSYGSGYKTGKSGLQLTYLIYLGPEWGKGYICMKDIIRKLEIYFMRKIEALDQKVNTNIPGRDRWKKLTYSSTWRTAGLYVLTLPNRYSKFCGLSDQ